MQNAKAVSDPAIMPWHPVALPCFVDFHSICSSRELCMSRPLTKLTGRSGMLWFYIQRPAVLTAFIKTQICQIFSPGGDLSGTLKAVGNPIPSLLLTSVTQQESKGLELSSVFLILLG